MSQDIYTQEEVLGEIAREAGEKGTQTRLAQTWQIPKQEINDVLRGRRAPTPAVLKRLGYERVLMYKRRVKSEG